MLPVLFYPCKMQVKLFGLAGSLVTTLLIVCTLDIMCQLLTPLLNKHYSPKGRAEEFIDYLGVYFLAGTMVGVCVALVFTEAAMIGYGVFQCCILLMVGLTWILFVFGLAERQRLKERNEAMKEDEMKDELILLV